MAWLEASALGHAMRESGPWTYAVVNLSHILGVSTLFGSIVLLDLRLLGVWRTVPLGPLSQVLAPAARTGFVMAAITGVGLLATNATEYIGNPFFAIKFPAIALGLINVALVHRSIAWRSRMTRALSPIEEQYLAIGGGVSLVCWVTAVAAGRLIAYW